MQNTAGQYEPSIIFQCVKCKNEECIGFLHKPVIKKDIWECDKCKCQEYILHFADKFTCPDCNKENIIVKEPNKISSENFDGLSLKIIDINTDIVCCLYCEHEFKKITTISKKTKEIKYWLKR